MFCKVTLFACIVILIAPIAFAEEIEGVYREGGSSIGIVIAASETGQGFIVQKVFLSSSGSIRQHFEWQSAFILPDRLPSVRFYWKTGRFDDSMPESNGLIVYDLAIERRNLVGTYFFPEEARTPPMKVTFTRVED